MAAIAKELKHAVLSVIAIGIILVFIVCAVEEDKENVQIMNANDAVAYVCSLGWTCNETGVQTKETCLPNEFDAVYSKYNELQVKQGFDLCHYKGERVTVYTIPITNYPNQKDVLVCLLTYKNRLIGGDIHSAALNGFMHTIR